MSEFMYPPGAILRRRLSLGGKMETGQYWHYGVASQYIDGNGEQMVFQFGGPFPGDNPYSSKVTSILNKLWPTQNGYTGVHIGLTPFSYFQENKPVEVEVVPDNPVPVLKRAERLMNHGGYNPAINNCEHYARYCLTGSWKSLQARGTAMKGGMVASLFVVAGVFTLLRRGKSSKA
tara:strand:+ start:506 stop:1033 length:528 start_codon:yes stop_codon:yes gene_type:complete